MKKVTAMRLGERILIGQFNTGTVPIIKTASKSLSDTTTWRPSVILTADAAAPFTGATDVLFGSVPALAFTVDSPTQITVPQAPVHAAGSAPITVIGPGGSSNAIPFEYWDPSVPIAPTSFMEDGDYSIDGDGIGRWTARAGFGAVSENHPPQDDPAGTPHFVAADGDYLLNAGGDWEALIGLSANAGCTIAIIFDLLSLPGPNGTLLADHEFLGALNIDRDGTGVPGVPAPQIWFAYNTQIAPNPAGYKFVAVHIAGPGRIALVFVRDVSNPAVPVIRMTADGVVYTADVQVSDLKPQTFLGLYMGNFPAGPYPSNLRMLGSITAKAAWSPANITKFYKWAALIP